MTYPYLQGECSYRRAEEDEEIQPRWSGCRPQHPPCLAAVDQCHGSEQSPRRREVAGAQVPRGELRDEGREQARAGRRAGHHGALEVVVRLAVPLQLEFESKV